MEAVTINVDAEVKAIGDALKTAIQDVKAKKSITEDLSDVAAKLIPALTGIANFAGDIKKVDNQVYLVKCLADALEPAPAA